MNAIGARTLKEIGDTYRDYDVIGIDEGQFFPDVSATFKNSPSNRLWNGLTRLPTGARLSSSLPSTAPF